MNLSPLEWGLFLAVMVLIALLLDQDRARWDAIERAFVAEAKAAALRRQIAQMQISQVHQAVRRLHDAAVVDTRIGVTLYEN